MADWLGQKSAYAVLAIGALLFTTVGARMLEIPLYADHQGASRTVIGWLFSTQTIMAALAALPAGLLVDRIGYRRLLLATLGVYTLAQTATGLTSSIGALFALQVVVGLAQGASQTTLMATMIGLTPAARLASRMGWLVAIFQAGIFAGPAFAGLLLTRISLPNALIVTAAPVGLALLIALWLRPRPVHAMLLAPAATPVRLFFGIRQFTLAVVAVAAGALTYGVFMAFYPLFGVKALHLSGSQVGFQLAFQALANGTARVPAGRLMDVASRRWPVIWFGFAGLFACVIALPFTSGFWVPAILGMVLSGCAAAAFSACAIVLADLAGPTGRGGAMGIYSLTVYLGQATGPAIVGVLIQRSGFQVGFIAAATIGMALLAAGFVAVDAFLGSRRLDRARPVP